MTETTLDLSAATRRLLLQRGLRLEYATLAWNVVGSVLMLVAAVAARSVALAGFGLDSVIEIVASAMVIWQLKGSAKARERTALRVIGVAFVVLALYIAAQSSYVLAVGFRPHHSQLGIVWLALTAAAMFMLAYGKAATGRALGNRVLRTEARVTVIDGLLAVSVLVGLTLNAWFGWWWADPLAAFVIVFLRTAREQSRACRSDPLKPLSRTGPTPPRSPHLRIGLVRAARRFSGRLRGSLEHIRLPPLLVPATADALVDAVTP